MDRKKTTGGAQRGRLFREHLASDGDSAIVGKMLRNASFGVIMMEIAGAVTYIIDGIMTSRFLGGTALAASGIASMSFTVLAILSGIIAAGSQKICSSEIGRGKRAEADSVFSTTFLVTVAVSFLVAVLGILFADELASVMGAAVDEIELHDYTAAYICGFFIGAPGHILCAVLMSFVQIEGANRLITASIAVLTVFDIAGNFVNVLVIHGGIFGMGVSTSVSYYVSAIVLFTAFLRENALFRLKFRPLAFDRLVSLLKIGLPRATKRVGNFLRPFFLNRLILAIGGSVAMSSFTVEQNIRYFVESVGVGLGQAVFLLAGIALGEKDVLSLRRISAKASRYIVFGVGALAVLYFVFSPALALLYLPGDSLSYNGAVFILRCHAVSLPFLAFNEYYCNLLQAYEKIVSAHIVTLLNKLVYVVALSFLLSRPFGTEGIWLSIPLGEILLAVTIFFVNAVKNRHNPRRRSMLSLFDDIEDGGGLKFEKSVQSSEGIQELLGEVTDFCEKADIDKKSSYRIELFFEEIIVLIMEHGFGDGKKHSVDILIYRDKDEIVLRTNDNCRVFGAEEQEKLFRKTMDGKYMGISMISKLAKNIEYVNFMNVNHFIITMPAEGAE